MSQALNVEKVPASTVPAAGRALGFWRRPTAYWTAFLAGCLGVGGVLFAVGLKEAADITWSIGTGTGLVPLAVRTVRLLLSRRFGVDLVAVLAMAGCLTLGEYLAGAVIALMFAGGQSLEAYAQGRARRELTSLAARTPRQASLYRDEQLVTIPIAEIAAGDHLLIKTGEVLPVDGRVDDTVAILDESALTGEAKPVSHEPGDPVRSGTTNSGPPFQLAVTSTAANSTYSQIIELVRRAAEERAPLVRLADRYAVLFLALTFVLAAIAWAVSGQPIRALAVLVIATPCPLIIAAPVAIVAGISRTARAGVIVKDGGVLEQLGSLQALLFDKTGTLTAGRPILRDTVPLPGFTEDRILTLAAAVDQMSSHPLATALRRAATERRLRLPKPAHVVELAGTGISGVAEGREIKVGRADFVGLPPELHDWSTRIRRAAILDSLSIVFISIDGQMAGALLLGDEIRPEATRMIRRLRQSGLGRIVMATGDHPEIAAATSSALGLDDFAAEKTPTEKAAIVEATRRDFGPVAFVGDGINDAPALATADVGIAIGSRGISAASEAADAVLVIDRLDGLADAITIARRTRQIALQSIIAGIGLSTLGMIAAAFGFLVPAWGAVGQELIDIVVIANALRALGGRRYRMPAEELSVLSAGIHEEHRYLRGGINQLRDLADHIGQLPFHDLQSRLRDVVTFLTDEVLVHETEEERRFYPLLTEHLGGIDPVATMLRTHVAIGQMINALAALAAEIGTEASLDTATANELRRLLYALQAILSLHNIQEEEAYISLVVHPALHHAPRMTAEG